MVTNKRGWTIENNKGYKQFKIGFNFSTFTLLAKIIELRKGLII